jgi:hypothetical protein
LQRSKFRSFTYSITALARCCKKSSTSIPSVLAVMRSSQTTRLGLNSVKKIDPNASGTAMLAVNN